MKTSSLEEVKAYFKNAKIVVSVYGKKSEYIESTLYENVNKSVFFRNKCNESICLYSNHLEEYAEIISYKEKTYQLSEIFVKELCKEPNIKEAFVIEGIIENDKLEVGKWYKEKIKSDLLLFFTDDKGHGYGFNRLNEWRSSFKRTDFYNFELATPKEVETALINEAKKRGYENGKINKMKNIYKIKTSKEYLLLTFGILYYKGTPIFDNGIWAEIIDETIEIKKSVILNTPNDLELGQLIRKMI